MARFVARELKQRASFASPEQELLLGIRLVTARLVEPWARFLKAEAQLTTQQYNALRILRGSHPTKLACGDIGQRMLDRDPDITRLVDRLAKRGLVSRSRSRQDRRIVEVGITEKGLALVGQLDVHALRVPKALLGHLGPQRTKQLKALLEDVLSGMGQFP